MLTKLDEGMPGEAAEVLHQAGWECDTVYDEGLNGADDALVAAACREGKRVLFTLDLDFADIRAYPPNEYVGTIVLRPDRQSRDAVLALLARVLPTLSSEWVDHQLWIVEPSRIRARTSGRVTG